MLTRMTSDISPDPLVVHPSAWRNDRRTFMGNLVKISINIIFTVLVICSVDP